MKPRYAYAIAYYPSIKASLPPRAVASISVRLTPKRAIFAGLYELCTNEQGGVQMGGGATWDRQRGVRIPNYSMNAGWRLLPSTIREVL